MLYSIIPPTLVVLSLVGIIVILVKKAPQVARLENENPEKRNIFPETHEDRVLRGAGGDERGRKVGSILAAFGGRMKNSLSVAKKIPGGAGMLLRKVRDRREESSFGNASGSEEGIDEQHNLEDDKFERFLERKEKRANIGITSEEVRDENAEVIEPISGKTKKRPVVRASKKDLFEKILIDRIAVNPKDIEAYERLGEYYLEIENWGYAKECFKQVLKLNPRNIGARSRMRKLERILGK